LLPLPKAVVKQVSLEGRQDLNNKHSAEVAREQSKKEEHNIKFFLEARDTIENNHKKSVVEIHREWEERRGKHEDDKDELREKLQDLSQGTGTEEEITAAYRELIILQQSTSSTRPAVLNSTIFDAETEGLPENPRTPKPPTDGITNIWGKGKAVKPLKRPRGEAPYNWRANNPLPAPDIVLPSIYSPRNYAYHNKMHTQALAQQQQAAEEEQAATAAAAAAADVVRQNQSPNCEQAGFPHSAEPQWADAVDNDISGDIVPPTQVGNVPALVEQCKRHLATLVGIEELSDRSEQRRRSNGNGSTLIRSTALNTTVPHPELVNVSFSILLELTNHVAEPLRSMLLRVLQVLHPAVYFDPTAGEGAVLPMVLLEGGRMRVGGGAGGIVGTIGDTDSGLGGMSNSTSSMQSRGRGESMLRPMGADDGASEEDAEVVAMAMSSRKQVYCQWMKRLDDERRRLEGEEERWRVIGAKQTEEVRELQEQKGGGLAAMDEMRHRLAEEEEEARLLELEVEQVNNECRATELRIRNAENTMVGLRSTLSELRQRQVGEQREGSSVEAALKQAQLDLASYDYITVDELVEVDELNKAKEALRLAEEQGAAYRVESHAVLEEAARDTKGLEGLRGELEVLREQEEELNEEGERYERCFTPRPDWERVAAEVPEIERAVAVLDERHEREAEMFTEARVRGSGVVEASGGSTAGRARRGHMDGKTRAGMGGGEEIGRTQYLAAELQQLVGHYQREQAVAAELGKTEERVHQLQRELQDARVQLAGCNNGGAGP
jgi:hypothetical protein